MNMENLNFKFVLINDNGEILQDDKNNIVYFEDFSEAKDFNEKNNYGYHVMREFPAIESNFENGRVIVRKA